MRLSEEAKVGLFTLIGLGLVVVAISFLGILSFAGMGYNLQITFDQVKGLKPENVVRYAGVDVGRVKSIEIADNHVVVSINVDKKHKIVQGSQFTIGSDGLLGEKFVDVMPPKRLGAGYIQPDSKLIGRTPDGLDEFMAKSSSVLAKMETMAESMNAMVGDKSLQNAFRQTIYNMAKMTENMESMTAGMDSLMRANQSNLDSMIRNLNATSTSLNKTMARLDSMVEKVDNNGQTSESIVTLFNNIASISSRMDNIARSLEGVATDEKTGTDLRATIANTRQASAKANVILDKVKKIHVRPDASVVYSGKHDDVRADVNLTVDNGGPGFLRLGVYDLGDRRKLNLQAGKRFGNMALRLGQIKGKAGVGLDYWAGDKLKIFTDLYDTHEHRIDVGTEFRLAKDFYLLAQGVDVDDRENRAAYFGVKQYF